jgi:AcrR family transcriptional regulator
MTRRFTDRSADTRAAILAAARRLFASEGYDKTTIRAVASAAGIDASMVMRYYGNKANLFRASAEINLGIERRFDEPGTGSAEQSRAAAPTPQSLAAQYARVFVEHWEKGEAEVERLVLRTAMTHPEAIAQVQRIFEEQVVPPLLAGLGDDPDARLRAALIMVNNLGMVLCRYLFELDPISGVDGDTVLRAMRAVNETVLTLPLSAD